MERIGFIGLGIMGQPMAKHLLRANYSLTALDINPALQSEVVSSGAISGTSPDQIAHDNDVIIAMLPDSPDVESVMFGKDGVMQGLRPGSLVIDMSTILPSMARRVTLAARAKGADGLDAPVSGGQVGAINATLTIIVGGSQSAFERAKPIFEKLGKNITLVGDAGAGQVTKAANQAIVGITIAAVSEALLLASKAGVDPKKVREALMGGFAQSRILELHGNRMIERNFQPGFKVKLHRKDMAIIQNTARELGLALPLSAQVAEMMNALIARGGGELDHSALVNIYEEMAHTRIVSLQ